MFRHLIASTFLCLFIISSCAQPNLKDYEGNWEGHLSNPHTFNFDITLKDLGTNVFNLELHNQATTISKKLTSSSKDRILLSLDQNTHFDLTLNEDGTEVSGFVKSGILMYHIELSKAKDNTFKGAWNPFMVEQLKSPTIFLSFENYDDGTFATYPFFGDQRFTGTWCADFIKKGETLLFRDFKTGLHFKAQLMEDEIELSILLSGNVIATTTLKPLKGDMKFEAVGNSLPQTLNDPPKEGTDGLLQTWKS